MQDCFVSVTPIFPPHTGSGSLFMYGFGFYWSGRCSNDKRAASDLFSEQLNQACKQSGAGTQTQWNRDRVHFSAALIHITGPAGPRRAPPRFTLTANWLWSPRFINVDCRTVTRRLVSSMLVLMLRIDPRAIYEVVLCLCVKCDSGYVFAVHTCVCVIRKDLVWRSE